MNKSEILDLILLKQEGSYWDFKREWYFQDKKADLLHDIICMANNLSNRDAYIIVGVDEENDYSFSSVNPIQTERIHNNWLILFERNILQVVSDRSSVLKVLTLAKLK